MTDKSDLILVKECLDGNTRAFEELVDRYQKPIFNLALRMVNGHEDVCDLTQTVFVKAYEKLKTFNPRFKFFSWIYRMAVNECLNFLKARKQHDVLPPDLVSAAKNPEEDCLDKELSKRVQLAIGDLPLEYRVLIIMRHFDDFSYQEIGHLLRLPEKTVKSRLFMARRLLSDAARQRGIVADDR
jgi:RNA polymerase sigma-70 factor, ECF subfamily